MPLQSLLDTASRTPMIRRDEIGPDGQQRWVLIPQIEHARISAALAQAWNPAALPDGPAREEMLAAIAHHDDGWAAWDAAPGVDPRTGIPRDFTEMPLAESLAIWRQSIEAAQTIGPLAAYAVSGHFSALLRQSKHWRSEAAAASLGEAFLREQDAQREAWLAASTLGVTAVAALQFFDRLSLWICCTRTGSPLAVRPPGSMTDCTLTCDADNRIAIRPWPLTVARLELSAMGRSLPTVPYPDREALEAATAIDVVLEWIIGLPCG